MSLCDVCLQENHSYNVFLVISQICKVKLIFPMITVTLPWPPMYLLYGSLTRKAGFMSPRIGRLCHTRSRGWPKTSPPNFFFPLGIWSPPNFFFPLGIIPNFFFRRKKKVWWTSFRSSPWSRVTKSRAERYSFYSQSDLQGSPAADHPTSSSIVDDKLIVTMKPQCWESSVFTYHT